MSRQSRALHFVLKIGNLEESIKFFKNELHMKVLRHEAFSEGCKAACNGNFDGFWTKTMIGYGDEDTNFVLELTYNFSVEKYKRGNDMRYISIALDAEKYDKLTNAEDNKTFKAICSPDGYLFRVKKRGPNESQNVTEVCLSCTNIEDSKKYWRDLLRMNQLEQGESKDQLLFNYDASGQQACLRLEKIEEKLEHQEAYGRIAFSCPSQDLQSIQKMVEEANRKVLTPYVSLDTPGKATVQVVILADPDGHEICFVGDEGFRELSKVDPKADELVEESLKQIKWMKRQS